MAILLCGAGGYGEWYLAPLLAEAEERNFRLVGVVDPAPERCTRLAELRERGIPIFPSQEAYHAQGRCDLAVLATPIHLHSAQTCAALAHGSHVLCEKPLCIGLDEIARMRQAEMESGRTVTVGYQWSFSPAIQRLKADILAGRLGAPRRLRTLVLWPRGDDYYRRNDWAGRQRLPSGGPIFDSPVSNATAHYLHNLFYLLGPSVSESCFPKAVEADLWRAHRIENYDTALLRFELEGAEALFYASHANRTRIGPSLVYEFEKATISYDYDGDRVEVAWRGGDRVDYGSPEEEPHAKLWRAMESARTGTPPLCGIAAASAHAVAINLVQGFADRIGDFPPASIRCDGSGARHVEGLEELVGASFREGGDYAGLIAEMERAYGRA